MVMRRFSIAFCLILSAAAQTNWFYRAGTRLYSADITDRGLANTQLLAEADEIRDAHRAFYRY
jgi:hypothetical protein